MITTLIQPQTQLLPDFDELNQKSIFDLIFVTNETRFINRLLQKVMIIAPLDEASQKIKDINSKISKLDEIINELKRIIAHTQDYSQSNPQQSIKDQLNYMDKLFAEDKKIKRELYAIVDELVVENKHNNHTKRN
jgi:hypothetical protein